MSDWNDVLNVLEYDSAIRSWIHLSEASRTVQATVTTEGHGDVTMIIENGANQLWLQLLVAISVSPEGPIWEAAGWSLRHVPAVGLIQFGNGIAIRHGVLLSHADARAITDGITLTATAATILFLNTTK
ncbi:hypothetical protein PV772_19160 [Pseudarthrobacter sp. CC12]|uniref:hypothetical protein n=1 Tax=Pseudarthrobacter sp. CC12 TaxID=3029193 RepID=UPI0032667A37